jgi:RES domain-containing protein
MDVWRLFPRRFRSTAFTGAGGLYAAGRWNHLGVPIVYTSSSRALAALEFFVNLEPNEAPDDLLIAEASVPEGAIETLDLGLLPSTWRSPNNKTCRDLGSAWAVSVRSLALKVPSAIVDGDSNVLLNPRHPDFGGVRLSPPRPFRYDPRMFR